jgi:hypothetical protein
LSTPVHKSQITKLGRRRRVKGSCKGRECLLRVAEHDVYATRAIDFVEEAHDVLRVPVDAKIERPHAHARVFYEPQERRVARVEADLADLYVLLCYAVPQDLAKEILHRVEFERVGVGPALK